MKASVFVGLTLLIALGLTSCGGNTDGHPGSFSLGGGSLVQGFTPTPTSSIDQGDIGQQHQGDEHSVAPSPDKLVASKDLNPIDGDSSAGKQIFSRIGCTACHTIADVEGAVGTVGPELSQVASVAGQRVSGLAAIDYLRESILEPGAYVVEGFAPLMPAGLIDEGPDLDALVAFLLTQLQE